LRLEPWGPVPFCHLTFFDLCLDLLVLISYGCTFKGQFCVQ